MKIVGLTGGIGSGKTTVAGMLVERGARLIDADLLARVVVEPGRPAYNDIVEEFGEAALNPDKTINRERLGEIVFADREKRERLNKITHPRIGEELLKQIRKFQEEGAKVTIFDAALLLETPATSWIKPVIVVAAGDEVKIERILARDGLARGEVENRIKSQWSDEQRIEKADFVINNSGDLASLEGQVDEVWGKIMELT